MNLAILALVAAIFLFPHIAHEQGPASPSASGSIFAIPKGPVQKPEMPEIMAKIAACESRDRQFDDDGQILKGRNKYDIGRYQINVLYWEELAKELGHDIYTEDGNEAMALELYRRYGTAPWKWSKKCWNK